MGDHLTVAFSRNVFCILYEKSIVLLESPWDSVSFIRFMKTHNAVYFLILLVALFVYFCCQMKSLTFQKMSDF